EVDHQSRAVKVADGDVAEALARRPVMAGRVDVRPGVHVRAHQHRRFPVAMVRGDVGDLDRLELRPGRHPVTPRLGQVDEPQYGKSFRPSCAMTFFTTVRSVIVSKVRFAVIFPKSFSLLMVPLMLFAGAP